MSLSLGTLEIGLGLNTTQYDSGIKSAKDQLSSLERRATALGTIKTGINGINQNIIKPSVDDTELTALNQHIDLKIAHQKEAQAFFDANPLTIKTDTTSLDNFIADAQAKIEQAITASINGNILINQSQSNKVQQKQTDNTAKAVGDAVAKAVKTNTPKSSGQGFFGLAISSMIAGLVQGVTFEKRRVLSQNISNLINATITKGVLIASEQGIIIDEKFIKTFSRKANKGINDLLKRATNEIVIKPDSPLKQAEQQGLNIEKQLESFLVNIFAGAKATVTQQQKTQQKTKKENLEKTEEALVLESVDLYNVEQKLAKAREFSVKKTLELIRDLELIVSDKIPDGEAVKNISGETDTETLRKRTEYLIGQGVKHSSLQSSNEHLKEIDSLDKKSLNISRQQQQNQSLLSAVKKELQSVRGESPNQEFLKILRDLNNGKLPDEASIPRLIVSDKRLKETGANALYNPTANAIIISSEIEEALNNLNLDESQVTALAHEIKHAIDLGFGSSEGKFLNRVGLTKENNINVDDPELSGFLDQYALRGDKRIELEASAEKTARKYAEQYFKTESPKESKPDAVVSEIQKLTEAILLLATGKNTTNIPLELPLTPVAEQERVPVTIGVNQNNKNLHRGTLNLMPPQIEVQKHTPESIQETIKTYSTQALQGLEDLSNTLKADIESGDLDKAIDTRNWIKQAGDDARTIINDYIKELKKELGVTRLPPELEKEFTAVKTKITTTQKKASQTTGKLGYYTKQQEKAINAQDLSQLMEDELASFNLSGLTQLAKTASGYSRDDFQSFSKFLSSPKTKELLKEAAVNVVGMSAGMAGGALSAGNPIVSMTSELGASLATRKAVNDIEATIDAYIEMTQQGTGDINGFFEKIAAIIERSKEIAKEKASEVEDALSGDAIGFGVGNISGTVLPQLGINIPMEGAVAAMALTPKLVEAKKKAQSEILSFFSKMTGQSNSSELGSLSQGSTDKYKELLNIYKQIDQIQEKIGTGEDLSSLQQTLEDLIKRSQELMGSFPGNTSQQQSTQQAEEQVDKVIGIFKNGYDKLLSNPLVSGALDLFSGIAGDAVNAIRNPVAAFETIKTKLKETKEGFIAAGIAVGSLAGLVVINTVMGKIANAVRDTGREFENLKVTINTALGRSSEQYLEKLYDQVYELGISFMSATAGYKQFAGALTGTSLQGISEQLFSIIQKVSAVNSLTESETQGVSTALSQMASKGIVSMEELRQQLSERLPGAMQIAARSMNMSLSEFDKAVSSGSIMSEDFLPKFLMQYERFADSGLLDMDKPLMTSEMQFQNSLEKLRIEMSKSTMAFDSMVATMLGDAINKVTDFAGIFGQVFAVINNILMLAFVPALGMALYKLGLLAPTLGMLGTVALPIAGVVAALSAVVVSVGLVTSAFNAGSESIRRNIESTRKVIEQLNGSLNQTAETTKVALSPYGKLGDAIFSTIENTVIKPILPSSYLSEKDKKNIKPFRLPRYADLDEQQIKEDISKQLSEGQQILFDGMQAAYSPEKIQFVKDELQRLNLEIDALNAKKISLQINNADPAKINQVQSEINKLIEARLKASDTLLPGGTQYIEKYISILKDTKKQLEGLQETNGFDFAVDIERTSLQIKQLEGVLDQLNASLTVTQSSFKVFQQLRKNLIDIPQNLTVQQASLTKESLLATMNKRGFSRENIDFEYRIKSLKLETDAILETQKQYEKFFASIANSEKTALEALLGKGLNQASLGDIENALEQASRSNLVSESAKKALEYLKESIANKNKLLELENKSLEIEREKIDRQAERNRNARQASIVGANVNERIATLRQLPFGGPVASYRDALSEVRNQERLLEEAYRRLESASDDPNVIQQEVDNTRLALEQARANLLQQQTSLEDYYRNLDRQIIDFNRQIEDYRRQIEDAQLSAFKENRSLSESYGDLVRELDKNLLNAQNQLLDTTDRIRVQQVKNRLSIPGTSDAGKELGDIFLEFVQGQADIASRGRTFQSRTEEIETSYISTLRNIRNLQEQQQEAERNRLRTIEDIKRTQENLNRTLADLIRQTNKELGFIPQSIKDIVTNLNTLPEPIKLINSELVAIPPNIKTSGEDLVKSIEETAEAIRKAKEGLILPAPGNFIPAPVWDGGGFLPPPPTAGNNINFRQTFDGSEFAKTPKNIFTYPVPNGQITGDQGDQHRGVDIFAPVGTPVLNIRAGTIVSAGPGGTVNKEDSNPNKPGYQPQHSIKIKFDIPIVVDGKTLTHAYYTHLTNLAQPFKPGQRIEEGVNLGGVGMAGGAPHLHLGLSETANFRGRSALSNKDTLRVLSSLSSGNLGNPTVGFPKVPFASLIEGAAKQYGIDPLLFAALIRKESGFRQEEKPGRILTSSAGAVGIAQLMPDTAKELGVDPRNVTQNLIGGAEYLAKMLKRFNGNIELALSAYKAGPGNVRNGQLARGTVEDVGIVMQYYREFQRMSRGGQGGPEFEIIPGVTQQLPPPPPISQNPINFRQTFNGSEFRNTPSNIFTYPVPNGQIYGDQGDQHRGVDVFAPVGTPVLNVRPGTVISAGPGGTVNKEDSNPNKPGYQPQQSIKIRFDIPIVVDGKTLTHAYYTHLTDLAQPFKPGQRIEDGVKLGSVGMAGNAPHLHLGFSETADFKEKSALSNKDTLRVLSFLSSGQGGTEFSSPPSIAQELPSPPSIVQLPTLPNQNQDDFWDADLPPVPRENPINFQNPNLPPVPNLPTANLGAAADQIRNAEIANQEQEERLRQLESSFLTETTLDRAIKFGRQQEEEARDLNRTIRDASESVTDLTINSKGYLTVQEEINKSATEVSRQYRSQIESLQDQRRNLEYQADGWQKMSENIKEVVAEQIALGQMPADVAEQFLKNADALAERAKAAKEQVVILDQAIEQLGRNQGVAALEASFRKTRDTVRSIRDRLNDLTIQRMRLEFQSGSGLFDDSAILAERISLQKEKEELEDYLEPYKDLPEYAEYVTKIRSEWEKLAELRLERVALDASPNRNAAESFFSDIREGKGIESAFSSLGLNIMTKFVEGITKPAIDALTSAIDGFTKPITQAFESVFNAIIGPVGNFFANALNSIFKPVGNIFSSIFGGGGGGGLFNGLLSGITGVFSGGLGGLGSIGSASIAPSSFISAPASSFSAGTGFKLFSDGGKVGDANAPIEKNIISAFQRERAMSGGRKPRLIVANEDELVLNPKETEAYLEYRNNAPIKNYANGGFVGGKPNYSTTSNNNNSNQSLVINNTNNVTVESRNDMGYSLNQLKERENAQNERTKKRFFS